MHPERGLFSIDRAQKVNHNSVVRREALSRLVPDLASLDSATVELQNSILTSDIVERAISIQSAESGVGCAGAERQYDDLSAVLAQGTACRRLWSNSQEPTTGVSATGVRVMGLLISQWSPDVPWLDITRAFAQHKNHFLRKTSDPLGVQ
ncbi:hypothetical protein VTN00DRAFT_1854 [Thermoascus crustaceus]|uniref:uncharacterized protein n=1 Tax=Thermoascus crustaceus TaxID=5088 RepID=UPI0037432E6E